MEKGEREMRKGLEEARGDMEEWKVSAWGVGAGRMREMGTVGGGHEGRRVRRVSPLTTVDSPE